MEEDGGYLRSNSYHFDPPVNAANGNTTANNSNTTGNSKTAPHTALQIESNQAKPQKKQTFAASNQVVGGGLSPLSESLWKISTDTKNIGDVSAWLSWKDLTVKVLNHKGETQTVLDNLTGYAEPGRFMAIMGPSGSGKSTLLDTLAGKLLLHHHHDLDHHYFFPSLIKIFCHIYLSLLLHSLTQYQHDPQ